MNKNSDRVKKVKKLSKTEVEVHNIDELSWMTDDNLNSLLEELQHALGARGRDPHALEVEICYVQRELDIRNSQRAAHSKWLANSVTEGTYNDSKTAN